MILSTNNQIKKYKFKIKTNINNSITMTMNPK